MLVFIIVNWFCFTSNWLSLSLMRAGSRVCPSSWVCGNFLLNVFCVHECTRHLWSWTGKGVKFWLLVVKTPGRENMILTGFWILFIEFWVSDVPWGQKHKGVPSLGPFSLGGLCHHGATTCCVSRRAIIRWSPGCLHFWGGWVRAKEVENLCGLWLLKDHVWNAYQSSFWPCGLDARCLICPFPQL